MGKALPSPILAHCLGKLFGMANQSVSRRRPTQADVARLAGVSQTTVSQVLNNSTAISVPPETRQRVLDAVAQLGYVTDHTARSLRTRRTSTIACAIPDIANPFYPAFARGIQDVAEQHGHDLVLYNTDGMAEKELKAVRLVQRGRADGLIVVLFGITARELFTLLESGVPVVRLESAPKASGPLPLDNLYVDIMAAAQLAVNHLIGRGHRRIGLISGGETPPRAGRTEGYRAAHVQAGLPLVPELQLDGGFRAEGGYAAMEALLRLPEPPTGVFCANDLMALGALAAARARGRSVPRDIAVVGFDDIPAARLANPALTTVAQFPDQLGRRAAELLFDRLEGTTAAAGRSQAMPFELIVRETG
jgi:LacI family transcriptional regulator